MRALRTLTAPALLMALSGCTPDIVEQNEAPVILRVTAVEGLQGGGGAGAGIGSVLLSDVRTDDGSVFNDNATITLANIPKNQLVPTLGQLNDVEIDSYRIRYLRTDGLSQEGVDVPFSFTGPATGLIPANGTGQVSILVVRHVAKREPPLANLARGGASRLITTFAEITIFGHTTAGKGVSATTRLEVHFGDFGG